MRAGLAGRESAKRIEVPGSGRYELLERVGANDLVEVFRARTTGPGGVARPLLFKRILPEILKNPACVTRLGRLAERIRGLAHPNIVRVLECGRLADGWCLVTEAITGTGLRWVVDALTHQALPTRISLGLQITHDICAGLAFAHQQRAQNGTARPLIHEGVCPDAVLISHDGCVKLTDFGLAPLRPTIHRAAYWAPEQARGKPADPRSDVFGAGAILYECVTGQPAVAGSSLEETLAQVKRASPVPPQQLNPLIGDPLEQIIVKALAPDPAARHQTAAEMAQAIELLAHLDGVVLSSAMLADWIRSARRSTGAQRAAVESVVHDVLADTLHDDSPKDWMLSPDNTGVPGQEAAATGVTTPWDELISAGSGELATAAQWMARASGSPAPEACEKETVPAPADEALAELTGGVEPLADPSEQPVDILTRPEVVAQSPLNPGDKATHVEDADPALIAVVRGGEQPDTLLGPGHEHVLSTGEVEFVSTGDPAAPPTRPPSTRPPQAKPASRRGLAPRPHDEEEEWVTEQQWQRVPAVATPAVATPALATPAAVMPAVATPAAVGTAGVQIGATGTVGLGQGPAPQPRTSWLLPTAVALSLVLLVLAYLALYLQLRKSEAPTDNTSGSATVETRGTASTGAQKTAPDELRAAQTESQKPAPIAAQRGVVVTSPAPHEPPPRRPGYLVITTDPPLAEVLVDGRPTGRMTPVKKSSPLLLSPGQHHITLTAEGRSVDVTVHVDKGRTAHVFRDLRAPAP